MIEQQPSHLERTDYPNLLAALHDADGVAADLVTATDGQLLVPAEHIAFLTRRLHQLVRGCIRVAREEGTP